MFGQIVPQVVSVVAHIERHVMVNLTGALVPQGLGVAVRPDGPIDRLPGFQLLAGAAVAAEDFFKPAELPHGYQRLALGASHEDALGFYPSRMRRDESVVVVI